MKRSFALGCNAHSVIVFPFLQNVFFSLVLHLLNNAEVESVQPKQ